MWFRSTLRDICFKFKDFVDISIQYFFHILLKTSAAYSEVNQTSKMKFFVKVLNLFQLLNIIAKNFILDVLLGSQNTSGHSKI